MTLDLTNPIHQRAWVIKAKEEAKRLTPAYSKMIDLDPIVWSDKTPTMAMSKGGVIYVNPKFAENLPLSTAGTIISHEIGHQVYGHAGRAKLAKITNETHRQWNIACDVPINEGLADVGGTFPIGDDGETQGIFRHTLAEQGVSVDSDWHSERIYKAIKETEPEQPPNNPEPAEGEESEDGEPNGEPEEGNGDSDGDTEGEQEGQDGDDEGDDGTSGQSGDGKDGDTEGDGDGQGGDGDGDDQGKGDTGSGDAEGEGEGRDTKDAQINTVDMEGRDTKDAQINTVDMEGRDTEDAQINTVDMGVSGKGNEQGDDREWGNGSASDGLDREWEDNEDLSPDADKVEEVAEDIKEGTLEGDDFSGSRGTESGDSESRPTETKGKLVDGIPVFEILKHLGKQTAQSRKGSTHATYSRVSRRQQITGVITPTLLQGTPKVGVILDRSGSMPWRGLEASVDLLSKISTTLRSTMKMVMVSSEVEEETVVRGRFDKKKLRKGGGTDMREGWEYFASLPKAQQPDIIICITDGETPWPQPEEAKKWGFKNIIINLVPNDPYRVRRYNEAKTIREGYYDGIHSSEPTWLGKVFGCRVEDTTY